MRRLVPYMLLLAITLSASPALASKTLREIARVRGQGASSVQGLGLVIGLNGTGDSQSELAVARPLAEVLRRMGNQVSVDEMSSAKSVALVMVTCEIPREGALTDDRLDITVSVINSAKSLEGGMLLVCPLTAGPGSPVYAFARGELLIPAGSPRTSARVTNGAQIVRDVNTTPPVSAGFDLILDTNFAVGGTSATIASEINQQYLLTSDRIEQPVAKALDERTVRVTVPPAERADAQAFFGDVMRTEVTAALRQLPARVICDTRAGIIVLTGDVTVSPAVITHKDLTISTIVQPPGAPPLLSTTSEFAAVETQADEADLSRLEDLIAAFDQLDVPPVEQIQILKMLHQAGKLHARLIIDGQE